MLLVFLIVITATFGEKKPSAFDGCNYNFILEPNVRHELRTKNYPNPDPPGTACSWSPSSALKESRIILSCPILKEVIIFSQFLSEMHIFVSFIGKLYGLV